MTSILNKSRGWVDALLVLPSKKGSLPHVALRPYLTLDISSVSDSAVQLV